MLSFFHRYLGIPHIMHVRDDRGGTGKPIATVVFVHGIGNTGATWDGMIADLPHSVRLITVDLLGFGDSPKPEWLRYNVREQARALRATLRQLRVHGRLIVVGHSLGALIAIEYARRYPHHTSSLILCAPPLYTPAETKRDGVRPKADDMLRRLYVRVANGRGERLLKFATLAKRYKLVAPSFSLSDENISAYMATLSASIVQQTSLADALELKLPVHIIRGRFDPLVIAKNLKTLSNENTFVSLGVINAGHDIGGSYIPACRRAITAALDS
jgi:pimeloyl-ACP methyl ester carboxylesterase